MPRSRRRHHSRSRTRSRSHSYDRDREPKRRKIESFESPQHKRSLSRESDESADRDPKSTTTPTIEEETTQANPNASSSSSPNESKADLDTSQESTATPDEDAVVVVEDGTPTAPVGTAGASVKVTPSKPLTPRQIQKKLEMESRRDEKRREREKALEEKLKLKEERRKQREELKQKENDEKELKRKELEEKKKKEREEKEVKRKEQEEKKKKEREEKEIKRKEQEEKNEQKRKEAEEKNKEKQKLEQKKQKTAAAFAKFFVAKKSDSSMEERKNEDTLATSIFMPFEVKSDMRLAPIIRHRITSDQKTNLLQSIENQNTVKTYLDELKSGKKSGKTDKTWPVEEEQFDDAQNDVIIVEEVNPGESIEELPKSNSRIRAKFLKFTDNRRPAYFGTWRKRSAFITPRKPLALDKKHFDYEVDSDDDWEDEGAGESLRGSDDEDKENESENEYEVDNEFFVPHGHLSDDEVNDEEDAVVSPEAHKAKLKLLKKEFDEEMQGKTQKIKPRVIGCIWYKENQDNVDSAIHEFLKPLSIISNGPIFIKKRKDFVIQTPLRKSKSSQPGKPLSLDLVPDFLKMIHGNVNNQKSVALGFINYLKEKKINAEVTKASLAKQLKQFAEWIRCPDDGPLRNKFCWYVRKDVKKEYNVDFTVLNK